MTTRPSLALRASQHAALGDPVRLAIADELVHSDRAPVELCERFGLESNLLSHHLDVLEAAALIGRSRSSGDGRRRYVHLLPGAFALLGPVVVPVPRRTVFVCTANSARSQLAAALWNSRTEGGATSAGTHPAEQVHHGAVVAGRRAGVELGTGQPRLLHQREVRGARVVTVCDRAHEELGDRPDWLHWSVPDPVPVGTAAAFDATVQELAERIDRLAGREAGA
ncbi:MAG: helix-turn-helix domain-containing protein [Acidimicrobiia bacterium]